MRIFILTIFTCLFSGLLMAQPGETSYKKGELLVMLDKSTSLEKIIQKNTFLNTKPTGIKLLRCVSEHMQIWQLQFDSTNINDSELLKQVKGSTGIAMAQFNHYTHERATIPTDVGFPQMWNLNNTGQSGGTVDADIDAPEAWDISTGGLTALGDTIVVAIVDGGFQLAHPDLNFWKNYHEIAGNNIDDDGNGFKDDINGWNAISHSASIVIDQHGTHVAGTAGARGNNGNMGVTGIGWNVKIMAVCGSSNTNIESVALEGYDYVLQNRRLYNTTNGAKGAFVVSTNTSFGVDQGQPSAYPLWCAMFDSLGKEGILNAGATANQNWDIDAVGDIPTACSSNFLISVTNTTRADVKYSAAGFGLNTIDLAAPGTTIYSTYPSNNYANLTGTSMAAPHITGSIGLMYAAACPLLIQDYKLYPDSIALVMRNFLLNGVDVLPALNGLCVTNGRLNIFNTLQLVQQYGNCSTVGIAALPTKLDQFHVNNVFPNPAAGYVEIEYTSNIDDYEVVILDVLGNLVKQVPRQNHAGLNRHKLNTSDLPAGVYFIGIKNGNTLSNFVKVVKV